MPSPSKNPLPYICPPRARHVQVPGPARLGEGREAPRRLKPDYEAACAKRQLMRSPHPHAKKSWPRGPLHGPSHRAPGTSREEWVKIMTSDPT